MPKFGTHKCSPTENDEAQMLLLFLNNVQTIDLYLADFLGFKIALFKGMYLASNMKWISY